MSYRVLPADAAFWRPSNQMGILNTDLARQLEADTVAARTGRLAPGQASTRHRRDQQSELYVVLEGTGRICGSKTMSSPPPSPRTPAHEAREEMGSAACARA